MTRGRAYRVRLARNIYRDEPSGHIAGVVRLRGHTEELRFPPGTPVGVIRAALEARLIELEQTIPVGAAPGTLAAICQHGIDRLPAGRAQNNRAELLQPWIAALGSRPWWALTRAELQDVADDWRTAGLSASRANKRISTLRVVWAAQAPDRALPHPIERVTRYTEPPAQATGFSLDLIRVVLAHVVDDRTDGTPSKTKARLRVLAWTGQPPARVMLIRPEHVRWDTTPPQLYVSPRRKGTGSADAWLPLLPEAADALRDFFAAGATGSFQMAPVGRAFARAVRRAQATLRQDGRHDDARRLQGSSPYVLRHSLLSALAVTTQDIYAVAEYAGHANLQTTRRYMRAAAAPRVTQAIAALAKTTTPAKRSRKRQ